MENGRLFQLGRGTRSYHPHQECPRKKVFGTNEDGTIKDGSKILEYNDGTKVEVEYVTVLCEDDSEEVFANVVNNGNADEEAEGAGEEAEGAGADSDETESDESGVVPMGDL